MSTLENIRLALRNVRANLLRSILPLLIIAFGIMALVGILTAIDSAIFALNDNFSTVGANSFSIKPGTDDLGGRRRGMAVRSADPITFREARDFKKRFDFPGRVTIHLSATGNAVVAFKENETNPNIPVTGIDEVYLDVFGYDLDKGRNFSAAEIQYGQARAIVGMELVKTLFKGNAEGAIGKSVSIGNVPYTIIGVLKSRGSSMNQSSDKQVFIPLPIARQRYARDNTNYQITVAVNDAESLDAASGDAIGLMRQVRKLRIGEDNDFSIVKSDSLLSLIRDNTANLRFAAIGIGMMTLLGAAIGLMNIMLVSVTERIREVGICKAVGANKRAIMMQFLTEALVICQLGGIVGILLGILIGNVVTWIMGGSFLIPWDWVIMGFTVCFLVGLVSGIYPAMKAARLDPIESLRHEG
jgi:putative ABC transport system permease protein